MVSEDQQQWLGFHLQKTLTSVTQNTAQNGANNLIVTEYQQNKEDGEVQVCALLY